MGPNPIRCADTLGEAHAEPLASCARFSKEDASTGEKGRTMLNSACVLYDAENVGGGSGRAQQIATLLRANGIRPRQFFCSGSKSILPNVANALSEYGTVVSKAPAVKSPDSADLYLATMSGFALCEATNSAAYDGVVIVSGDKSLIQSGEFWTEHHFPVIIVCRDAEAQSSAVTRSGGTVLAYEPKRNSPVKDFKTEIVFDEEVYPYSFCEPTIPLEFSGLRVLTVPFRRNPVPQLIRFPIASSEITVGSLPGRCTLPLEPWDKPRTRKTGGLYSPHVFIGCGVGGWYVRSCHGLRRVSKAVEIDGRLISASKGNVPLSNGSELRLGDFRFRVTISAIDILDVAKSDDSREALAEAEQRLHGIIAKVLYRAHGSLWWESVPPAIRADCEERRVEARSAEQPYRFVFIRELKAIVIANWEHFRGEPFTSLWRSRTQMRDVFSSLISVRNTLMHPTRTAPSEMEIGFVLRLRKHVQEWEKALPA